jgi:hypothetical protein
VRSIPAKSVSQTSQRARVHVGERDGHIDGDVSCDDEGVPGGFEAWDLPDQEVSDEPVMISPWSSIQARKGARYLEHAMNGRLSTAAALFDRSALAHSQRVQWRRVKRAIRPQIPAA